METAGAPPPPAATLTERPTPAFKPPHILWFFGAFAITFATYGVLSRIPESHRELWEFLVSLGFVVAYAGATVWLRRAWWIPTGLAAAMAVAILPAVGFGFTSLIGTLPKDVPLDPAQRFSWSVFLIALASAIAGLVAFAFTRFAFLFFTVVVAASLAVQFLLPGVDHHPSAGDHFVTALVWGVVVVLVGLVLDGARRRRDAFWFHVAGFTNVAVALSYYATSAGGNANRGWVPMIVAGAIVLLCSAPLSRGTWAAFGLLGFYAPILHWLTSGVGAGSTGYAWLLLAIGVSIFLLGFALSRSGRRTQPQPPPAADEPET
jgi:hypothetical protein